MQSDDRLDRAVSLIFGAAPADTRVILFGSRGRGEHQDDSDYDFLVVETDVSDRFAEMARLSEILGGSGIPADVVVVSKAMFDRWRNEPNNVVSRAVREGTFFEPAA
ncbi:MAG: nucleotidyltransferase domain-containing protein [Planctomycetota bacterium]